MYSVGIASIDSEHKKLVDLLNQLWAEMMDRRGPQQLAATIDALIDYTAYHFSSEEKLMRVHRYPDYTAHCAEHNRLTSQVLAMRDDYRSGRSRDPNAMVTFLRQWILNHIMHTDKQYTSHLRTAGAR